MGKRFPAVRLVGATEQDKARAATHIRRAKVELQRARDLRRRMGVPIYKRDIEIDEYTRYYIVLSKKQEFIYVICSSVGFKEYGEGEEEKEYEKKCIPGFTFYRNEFAYGDYPETNGHFLIYKNGKWEERYPTDEDPDNEDKKASGNCAWWHLKANKDTYKNAGALTGCELITWLGDTTPHVYTATGQLNTRAMMYRDVYGQSVFFQGKQFKLISDWSDSYITGACLLNDPDDGEDYMYCLYATPYRDSYAPYCRQLAVYRFKWTPELTNPSLQYLGRITTYDIGDAAPGGFGTNNYYGILGRSAYVDKDGRAYFVAMPRIDSTYLNQQLETTTLADNDVVHLCSIDLKTAEVTVYPRDYSGGLLAYMQYTNNASDTSAYPSVKLKDGPFADEYYYSAELAPIDVNSNLYSKSWYVSRPGMLLQSMVGGLEKLYLIYSEYKGSGTFVEKTRIAESGEKIDVTYLGYDPSDTPGSFDQRISTVPVYTWSISQELTYAPACWSADLVMTRVDTFNQDTSPTQGEEIFRDTVIQVTRSYTGNTSSECRTSPGSYTDMKWGETYNDPPNPILWYQGPCAGNEVSPSFSYFMPGLFTAEKGTTFYGTIEITGYPWLEYTTTHMGDGGNITLVTTTKDYCFLHPLIPHRGYIQTTTTENWTVLPSEDIFSPGAYTAGETHNYSGNSVVSYVFDGDTKWSYAFTPTAYLNSFYPYNKVDAASVDNLFTTGLGLYNTQRDTFGPEYKLYYPFSMIPRSEGAVECWVWEDSSDNLNLKVKDVGATTNDTFPTISYRGTNSSYPYYWYYIRCTVALHQKGLIDRIDKEEYPYVVYYTHPNPRTGDNEWFKYDFVGTDGGAPNQDWDFFSNVITLDEIKGITGEDSDFCVDFGVI